MENKLLQVEVKEYKDALGARKPGKTGKRVNMKREESTELQRMY
jgi:hypothetical protein